MTMHVNEHRIKKRYKGISNHRDEKHFLSTFKYSTTKNKFFHNIFGSQSILNINVRAQKGYCYMLQLSNLTLISVRFMFSGLTESKFSRRGKKMKLSSVIYLIRCYISTAPSGRLSAKLFTCFLFVLS